MADNLNEDRNISVMEYDYHKDNLKELHDERVRVFGKEITEGLESTINQIGQAFFLRLRGIISQGGDVTQALEKWRDFSNSLYETSLPNTDGAKPEMLDIAINGSAALLTPEKVIGRGYDEDAQKLIDELSKRY